MIYGGISVKLISTLIDDLDPYLALIFNNATKVGYFQDLLKMYSSFTTF